MTWPISWPASVDMETLDPNIKALCEVYATACMTALTLHRVGGNPVTILPDSRPRVRGRYASYFAIEGAYPVGAFYPGLLYPSALDLKDLSLLLDTEAIDLPGPVGEVTEVKVGGEILDPAKYRIEDGRFLVRIDGGVWPADAGDSFTVTYFNSHPVDAMGAHAAGVMANEWLMLLTTSKKCRLPASATTVNRQGITMEITRGMFPEGVTGIPEIDAYLMLWNPFGLKVAPRVYSPDLPAHRQVWHA